MPSEQILQEKNSEVEEITRLIKKNNVIGTASLQKVRAPQLQNFKKSLSDKVNMKVVKNTIMKRAIANCRERAELQELIQHLEGSNIFLFTDMNPFRLALLLQRSKVKITAKSGDKAAFDVTVPAGNTGQPPGPIISQLNAVGLRTRIESGSVWINKDTLVAKKDDVISESLAAVLSKLGIKPVEAGLTLKVAYDDGVIITEEQLQVDLDRMRKDIENAYSETLALSLAIAYPTAETIKMLVQVAHQQSYALAISAAIPTRETIEYLIQKAEAEVKCLSGKISNQHTASESAEE